MAFDPDTVVTGQAAGHLLLGLREPPVIVAATRSRRRDQPGFAFELRRIDPDFVTEHRGVRCTDPALTAIDLAATDDGTAIDAALRQGAASLTSLRTALSSVDGRRGHLMRRRILADSRDEPWSGAERLAHRLLRTAQIRGWRANQPIMVGTRVYFGDIVFRARRLLVEIDGWQAHGTEAAFQSDRIRQNSLVIDGWRVLRFTWADLRLRPDVFVSTVRSAL